MDLPGSTSNSVTPGVARILSNNYTLILVYQADIKLLSIKLNHLVLDK